jgi:hypothetical protein
MCGQREFKKYTEPEHEIQEDEHGIKCTGRQLESFSDTNKTF